jgi:hypothetical protein
MWVHQAGLPTLPLPTIEESTGRFLRAIQPLSDLSGADIRDATAFCQDLLDAEAKDGSTLQQGVKAYGKGL